MRITVVAPSEQLAPFVRRFAVIEADVEATRSLLPELGLMLGVRFRGTAAAVAGDRAIRLPDATLTGMVGAARRIRTSAGGAVFVAFRETGAARFFAPPLHELFGSTLALDDLAPRTDVARLQDRIAGAADHRGRITHLEQFLLTRLRSGRADPVADAAVAAIRRTHGALRITQLARDLGISRRPLENRFRCAVGTSPKQLASLVRLRHLIDARRGGASWSRLAIESGYFDQSHFNREFRAVTGESPRGFFAQPAFCALPSR